jgi:hypothetical protein
MASIFDRQGPPNFRQLITVAERRFDDAQALCDTGKNQHANGAQYLGGFVIELLLKAQLLRLFENVGRARRSGALAADDQRIRDLLFSHDLNAILRRVTGLEELVAKRGERDGRPYRTYLREICTTWNIFARYSTRSSTIAEAEEWLSRIRELKEVLR